ncbi:lambda exonuclease family protein [Duganella phyllosphaerae]|uniref:YqaJ-like viral recombinase domain protein n=1 Tax=Duganella phyllosphaerae TaxID=762836 RepID=A0A1E7W6D8_9BURK|nr:lambda exonuclease family protein [Duganella phyllosphaerae]OEZ91515.1 YqaJ-like viral recombinase domain protein [Duganella phyllosphaerae]
MIVLNCAQGSPEWHQARAGVITASMFVVARSRTGGLDEKQQAYVTAMRSGMSEGAARDLAGYRAAPKAESIQRAIEGLPVGDFSEAAKAYAFRLAIERISGMPLDESFETYAMRRGHELEPAARREHEIASGHMVQRAGFVLSGDHLFGASADGLIGKDGGSEYKCLISPERLQRIYIDGDASEFMDQVQGCMWLTARKWWDFCVYCPAMEIIDKHLWMRTYQRDDEYIDQMVEELAEFEKLVTHYETTLRMKEAV